LGIRQSTAVKLLRSYAFLEAEDPGWVKRARSSQPVTGKYPDLDSVNLLRRVKDGGRVDDAGYAKLRKQVFEDNRPPQEIRLELQGLRDEAANQDPVRLREERRAQFIRRLYAFLHHARKEALANRFLTDALLSQLQHMEGKLEKEFGRLSTPSKPS